MATYTKGNLTDVREAIMRLATGQSKVSVQFSTASGMRSITYRGADLDDLRKLEALIVTDLGTEPTRSRTVLTRSRKGL